MKRSSSDDPQDSLTPRQREILDFIRASLDERGAPPTRLEICQAFGFASPNAAEEHLRALARKGAIIMGAGSARGIRLVKRLAIRLSEQTTLAKSLVSLVAQQFIAQAFGNQLGIAAGAGGDRKAVSVLGD